MDKNRIKGAMKSAIGAWKTAPATPPSVDPAMHPRPAAGLAKAGAAALLCGGA